MYVCNQCHYFLCIFNDWFHIEHKPYVFAALEPYGGGAPCCCQAGSPPFATLKTDWQETFILFLSGLLLYLGLEWHVLPYCPAVNLEPSQRQVFGFDGAVSVRLLSVLGLRPGRDVQPAASVVHIVFFLGVWVSSVRRDCLLLCYLDSEFAFLLSVM